MIIITLLPLPAFVLDHGKGEKRPSLRNQTRLIGTVKPYIQGLIVSGTRLNQTDSTTIPGCRLSLNYTVIQSIKFNSLITSTSPLCMLAKAKCPQLHQVSGSKFKLCGLSRNHTEKLSSFFVSIHHKLRKQPRKTRRNRNGIDVNTAAITVFRLPQSRKECPKKWAKTSSLVYDHLKRKDSKVSLPNNRTTINQGDGTMMRDLNGTG